MSDPFRKVSKYLSYILRHHPDSIGLTLDEQGWARVDELIEKSRDVELDLETLVFVVENNDKQRFSLSEDGTCIRANQGHSIAVDLALESLVPPEFLLHGTAERFVPDIRAQGLKKMQRHHVHMTEIARQVGGRYGKPVLLTIHAGAMHRDGYDFYLSQNKVWLVSEVPPHYIQGS